MILYICKKQPATWFEDTGHLIQSLPAIPSIAQVMNHPVRNHHIERIVIKGQLACVASIDRDALSYSLARALAKAASGRFPDWSFSSQRSIPTARPNGMRLAAAVS